MSVDFKAKQIEFVAYIRNPANNPRPADVQQQRIRVYRELLFNNVDSFLSSNFPVLKTILTKSVWFELVQDFFAKHACTTPYFSEIPEEFLDYLQNHRKNNSDYPFLLELTHYEWVEMALTISKDESSINTKQFLANLTQENLSLSTLAWPLAYQFPVQKISPSFLPKNPPSNPTYLLVYRGVDYEVNFIQISAYTFRMLQILQDNNGISTTICLNQMAKELAHSNPKEILKAGLQALTYLAAKNIIQATD